MKKTLVLFIALALLALTWPASALAQTGGAAELTPAHVPLFLSVDTRPGFLQRIERLANVFSERPIPGLAEEFDQLVQVLLTDRDTTFIRDVRPWLGGEIAIALEEVPPIVSVAMSGPDAPPPQPNAALLLAAADPDGAAAFLERLVTSPTLAQATREEMTYGGFSYTLLVGPEPPSLALGVVNGYLVVGLGSSSIEMIIDVANGAPALAGEAGFQRVYGGMDPGSLLRFYVGPSLFTSVVGDPSVYVMLSQALASGELELGIPGLDTTDPQALQQQMLDILSTFQGFGVALRNVNGALVLDLLAGIDLKALEAVTGVPQPRLEQGVGEAIFARFPADTLGVAASHNLAGLVNLALSTVTAAPEVAAQLAEAEAELEAETGLKLHEDVLAWLDGSIALGFVPNPLFDTVAVGDPLAEMPVHMIIIIEATDAARAQNVIDALAALDARQGHPVQVSEIDGVQVTTFSAGDGELLHVGLVDGYVVMVTGDVMARMIETARGGPNYTQEAEWRRLTDIAAADGPFFAALDLVAMSQLAGPGDVPPDTGMMRTWLAQGLGRLQTAAIIAPAAPGGGPARVSLILTLASQ